MRSKAALAVMMLVVALGGMVGRRVLADPPPKDPGKGFPDLVAALKDSPGCLGVETARTTSGKSVIFAWFEDKKATLRWYYSDTHNEVMKHFFPNAKRDRKPLADVPEDSGPIMAIASVTMNDNPNKDNPSPFKQIAIELYQPLGGGLAIGGRFAPDKLKTTSRKAGSEK